MDRTNNTIHIFDKYASKYLEKYKDLNQLSETIDFFIQSIGSEEATILELACGPGIITKYLILKKPQSDILAVDFSKKMIEMARKYCPEAEYKLMDCRELNKIKGTYDAIICGFLLPYLDKEETTTLISDIADLLKPQGVMYLSAIEGSYSSSGFSKSSDGGDDTLFMYYHQEDYLREYLIRNNFSILKMQRLNSNNPTEVPTRDLVIVSRKNE